MRLSTQFKITLFVFSLLLIIIAASVAFTFQEVDKTRTQENLANSVVQGASDLTYLSNDYVIYQGDQQLSQWQTRYASFSQDVSNLNVDTQEQQALVSDIIANQQRMKTVFDSLVTTVGTSKIQNATPSETLSIIQVSWSRISIQTQAVSSDGTRLAQLLRIQVDALNTFNSVLIFAIVGTFSAFLGVIYLQTFRRTLKSLSDLRAGAVVIGSGNLEFKLKEDKKDEIGELSQTFNQMTTNLKTVTASKTDLEREIVDRKKAEEALKRQAELIDLSPDAIIVKKLNGTITFWSKGAYKLYGWTKEEANKQDINILLKTESRQPIEEILSKVKQDGEWSGEIIHTSKDGSKVVVQSYWLGKTGADNKIVEILESNVDITDRINLESKLEESAVQVEEYANQMEELANKRAEQLKDAERLATIGATAGMVGHDIRNPLQAITGDIFLAKTELIAIPESEEKNSIQESLSEIEKNVDYINKIVADLQDFARPLRPNAEETDLKLIIDDLLKKNGLPENVKVTVKVDAEARKVVADSTFINRIMYNLVTNAVQAMPKGGKLTILAYKEAKDVLITVKDTGVGIPEKVRGKLFTPMFTTKSKGQGFGLAVIKRMTESLGGIVSFESEEGKGTTFIIRLPQKINGVSGKQTF